MPQRSHESKKNLQKGVVQRIRKEKLSISLPGSGSACALAKKYTDKKYRTHRTYKCRSGAGKGNAQFFLLDPLHEIFFF
jgi:hypothetical protein